MIVKTLPHIVVLLMTGILGGSFAGCSTVEVSKIPKKPLPASPPLLSELSLELPSEGGPRRPIDPLAPLAIQGNLPTIILVEKDESALRSTAEEHSEVKTQLGERYGFINSQEMPANRCLIETPSEEGEDLSPSTPLANAEMAYRLTYYSYTHNSAVHVCINGNQVTAQPDPRKGYQPPEGVEEIKQAIALARKDSRIAQDVQNLFGHAILTSPEEYRYFWVSDEAGFGDRVLWVTFSETPESLALYFARVDLTNGQVLDAGKEPGPQ